MSSPVVLFVLTSRSFLATEDASAGSWLEELAAPYYIFKDAGCEVLMATPKGGEAPIDPNSLGEPWLTAAGERFLSDEESLASVKSTALLGDVDTSSIDGVFMVGGAAVMWDFPTDPDLGRILTSLSAAGRLIAGVCHGVAGLLNDNAPADLVRGRTITCISNKEDELAGYDQVVPFMPEGRFRELGATVHIASEPFAANVECCRNIVTGQNPASAEACARQALATMRELTVADNNV